MVSDADSLNDIMDRVMEFAEMTRTAIDESMPGAPLDATKATDEDFAKMIEQLQQADPDYMRALPFVDGGMEYITRYEKIRGLR